MQAHVCLKPYNTLAIGAKARWFCCVTSMEELQQALAFAKAQAAPLFILGGGSNVVFVEDFPGVVLQIQLKGIKVELETSQEVHLLVAAGENWHQSVMYCVARKWYGLENLALIPGTVGAAPIQNIGAYGVEMADCCLGVAVVDCASGQRHYLEAGECGFAYRDSYFKGPWQSRWIITHVMFRLYKQARPQLQYPALAHYFDGQETPDIDVIAQAVIDIRQSKLPDPAVLPNAGSFFKNPCVSTLTYQRLKQHHPQLVAYPQASGYKLAAGWLLEHAGWKAKACLGVVPYERQALVLTNPQEVNGRQLLQAAQTIQADIQSRYGITLEIEPRVC